MNGGFCCFPVLSFDVKKYIYLSYIYLRLYLRLNRVMFLIFLKALLDEKVVFNP